VLSSDWAVYEDDVLKLSYPSLWWAGQTELDLQKEPYYQRTIKSRFGCTVRVLKHPVPFNMTAERYAQAYKAQMKAARVFTSDRPARLAGAAAVEFENKHTVVPAPDIASVKLHQRVIVRDSGDDTPREGRQVYVVTVSAGVRLFKEYEDVWARIVSSIEFFS
jgi:hypothetical protein